MIDLLTTALIVSLVKKRKAENMEPEFKIEAKDCENKNLAGDTNYWFRIRHRNGNILLTSETMRNRTDRNSTAWNIFNSFKDGHASIDLPPIEKGYDVRYSHE